MTFLRRVRVVAHVFLCPSVAGNRQNFSPGFGVRVPCSCAKQVCSGQRSERNWTIAFRSCPRSIGARQARRQARRHQSEDRSWIMVYLLCPCSSGTTRGNKLDRGVLVGPLSTCARQVCMQQGAEKQLVQMFMTDVLTATCRWRLCSRPKLGSALLSKHW